MLGHGKKKKAIEIRDGYPIAVKSNLISECFGRYLINSGTVDRKDVEESFARVKKGEGLQGEIL